MSGTTDISTRFTCSEICAIIKQCGEFKVSKINVGELNAEFFLVDSPREKTNLWSQPEPPQQTSVGDEIQEYNDEIDLTAVHPEGDKEVVEELRRYELMTSDPVAFEQEMIDRQLEKDNEEDAKNAETRYWPT